MSASPLTLSGLRRLLSATLVLTGLTLPLVGGAPAHAVVQAPVKVNFGPSSTPAPAGYTRDLGGAYTATRKYGWIRQTSSTPVSITANTRDRNKVTDQRLDTLIAMQTTPARWEAAVQNGIYDVTVAVGDVAFTSGSTHRITVETTRVIDDFVPSAKNATATVTSRVRVTDGKITLDAAGGTGTKLDYVDIIPVQQVIGAGPTSARINFAPSGVAVPHRYVNDAGAAYTGGKGYGWISQSSSTPLSIVGNSRDRDAAKFADQRLDTFMCMQYGGTGGVNQPARWQYALPVGTYDVTVSVGDATTTTGSTHRLAAEGTVAIDNFVPSSTTRFKQATVRVSVTDGFLTLDAAGGTNTKINFVEIVDADNTARTITAVDPVDGEDAVPVDTDITLTTSHAVDPATVSASTVKLLAPGGTPVAGALATATGITFTPSTDLDAGATYTVQTTTGLRDTKGNAFAASSSTFTTVPPAPVNTQFARINFQPQTTAVPTGYSKDFGQAYETTRGFGWVEPGTTTPVSLNGLGRVRNVADADPRLDTFVLMQSTPAGDWQVAAPDGTYDVTVAVGDLGVPLDSTHQVSAEGSLVVGPFNPVVGDKTETGTAQVQVTDGFLTLAAAGGTNTKIDYVDIDRVTVGTPPPADTWNPKVELNLAGAGAPDFTGQVTVTPDTTDLGTGVASVAYSVDAGPSTPTKVPFTVNTAGTHTVVVTATDGAGNTGSASSTFTITPPADSAFIKVTSSEDALELSSRIVFSTVRGAATPARSVTVTNTGTSDLTISDISIAGANPNQFTLDDGQATSLVIPAGQSATVSAKFVVGFLYGVKTATLNLTTNDPLHPTYVVALRGVNAGGTVGDTEPTLDELVSTLGYTTDTGVDGTYQATTRAPVGDEVIAPYFTRVDTTKPVGLHPVARYVAATSFTSDTGYAPTKYSGARNVLYRFPADTLDETPDDGIDSTAFAENQKLMPAIAADGTNTWNPSGVFGVAANYANYTDDQFNKADDGTLFRNIRVYPAKGPGGVVIPNTWLLAVDINLNSDKNYDFQDQVMLLTNATPELTAAASPGSAATSLELDAPAAGTVLDKDGQGTGFASVQANTGGTQYDASRLDLTGGTLRITSTAGKNSGTTNTQVNAVQVHVDASRSNVTIDGRILGPMSDLTAGFQQKAIWFGPDQNNYLKLEIEHRDTGGVHLTLFKEEKGVTATIGQVAVASPGTVSTLDFRITGTMQTNSLQAGYRINSSSGAFTSIGTAFGPANPTMWFSPQGRAGVLVSHTGSTTPITGVFDWFRVH